MSVVLNRFPVIPPSPAKKRRLALEAKGKRLERAIRGYLEAQGWHVETAHKMVKWLVNEKTGKKYPRSFRHDLYEVWDGIAFRDGIEIGGGRRQVQCYQVTTWHHVSDKRSKIEESKFPVTKADKVYGYVGRPGKWRILSGPTFELPGEEVKIKRPATAKKAPEVEAIEVPRQPEIRRPYLNRSGGVPLAVMTETAASVSGGK